MKIIKKTLVVLILCSFIMGTIPVSVLAQQNNPDNNIFEHKGPDFPKGVEYAPGEFIVQFKSGVSDREIANINSRHGTSVIYTSPNAGFKRLHVPNGKSVHGMVEKYKNSPYVEYAEPNYKVYVDATIPNDYYFSLLWGMHNTGQSGGTVDADIDAPEAWDITTGSDTIVVAVIDTGVDYNHKDLDANIWKNPGEIAGDGIDNDGNGYVDDIRGWDFFSNDNNPYDESGHGTHCSGTIAAVGNNDKGVVGVSWNAKIMPLRFLGPEGGYTSDAVLAIHYAIDNGADIMSNSWGGGGYSVALEDAISTANDAGILFVAAAGNNRKNTDRRPHYPSSYDVPNIISVAATDRYDNLASFSNYGPNSVDLGAPGVDILSTYPGGYAWGDGTSMAAPHVSGAAALIMAENPTISVDALKAKILDSVDPIDALAGKTVTGGRLNVFNCLEANTELDTTPPIITNINSLTTSTTATITWTTDELSNSTVNYGTTNSLGSTGTDGTMTTSNSITLIGLSTETIYCYEVKSTDLSGNPATDDNDGVYYTFTTTSDTPPPGNEMHIASIDMSTVTKPAGRNDFTWATATVTVEDSTGIHVEGAQVIGIWSDLTSDTEEGITESDGTVTLRSDSEKNLDSGTFTFTVTGVYLAGWTYNPSDNAEDYQGSITVPE